MAGEKPKGRPLPDAVIWAADAWVFVAWNTLSAFEGSDPVGMTWPESDNPLHGGIDSPPRYPECLDGVIRRLWRATVSLTTVARQLQADGGLPIGFDATPFQQFYVIARAAGQTEKSAGGYATVLGQLAGWFEMGKAEVERVQSTIRRQLPIHTEHHIYLIVKLRNESPKRIWKNICNEVKERTGRIVTPNSASQIYRRHKGKA